jgi:hypothetical protein
MNKQYSKNIGYSLIALSIACWLLILTVPFLGIATNYRLGLVAGLVVLGEIFFWIGSVLLGKHLFDRFNLKRFFQKSKK